MFPFRFILFAITYSPQKAKKNTLSAILSPILAFAILFQTRFVEFVSMLESLLLV
jgi:hypothetical protein